MFRVTRRFLPWAGMRRSESLNGLRMIVGPDGQPNLMDLEAALRQLYEERERIERVIASLSVLIPRGRGSSGSAAFAGKRQGRRSMGQRERQEVSKRMKKYWARRRSRREDHSNLD
jgi:hypothetical protein